MLETEELHSAAVGLYNGNLGGLTVLTTMIISKSGRRFHATFRLHRILCRLAYCLTPD